MTTTEEVIRLAREMADTVCNEIGPVAMCKDPLSFAQEVGIRLIEIVRAEENEACAKDAHEFWIRNTDTSPAEAIRARRNHG